MCRGRTQLKRGISTLREENNEMASTLSAAEIAARRDAESAEVTHAKRLVSIVAAERDAQVVLPSTPSLRPRPRSSLLVKCWCSYDDVSM